MLAASRAENEAAYKAKYALRVSTISCIITTTIHAIITFLLTLDDHTSLTLDESAYVFAEVVT